MILASAKSDGISITGDVCGVWKIEIFSRLRLQEPFPIEDLECFFPVLFPDFFRRSGDTGLNRTEVADISFSNRIFCDCFGETLFLGGSGDLLLVRRGSGDLLFIGEVHFMRSVDVDFDGLDGGTEFFFRESCGEISCSLLLHVQTV